MILHIVRKDLRLLWPFVAGVALLHFLAEWARYRQDVLGVLGSPEPFEVVAVLGWVVLVAAVVHQDVVPGTRQDWLTRPIRRFDLVAAKLVFLLALMHGPVLVANVVEVLAAGFSLPQALAAAASRGVSLFTIASLSTFALAAVTRNMFELVVAGIVVAFVSEIASLSFLVLAGMPCATCGTGTGVEWVAMLGQIFVLVVGALAVLGLQYFKRGATRWGRAAVLVATVVYAAVGQLPWSIAHGVQQRSTGAPAAPADVALELDLARGNVPAPDMLSPPNAEILRARASLAGQASGDALAPWLSRETQGTTLALPLKITRGHDGDVVWADRVDARLIDADGRVVYRGRGDALEVHSETEEVQTLFIPTYVLDRHRDDALKLELDYSLTALVIDRELALPAAGGEARFASNDRCITEPLRDRTAVRLRCLTLQRPSCYIVRAENRGGDERVGERLICKPDYSPFRFGARLFDSFEIDVSLPDDARLEEWLVRYVPFRPREHFTTRLRVPQFQLADWAVE